MSDIRIGLSGWRYRGWRGDFYPPGLVQRKELSFAAARFGSVEINGSFYSLQRPTSYQAWAEQTPHDFIFAVKGGRLITHMKQLRDVDGALANFFASGMLALGTKLGPVLWQLPARTRFDPERLSEFFAMLPRTTSEAARLAERHDDKLKPDRILTTTDLDRPIRHSLEPRHPSFGTPDAIRLLQDHDIALVVSDAGEAWPRFEEVTSDYVYVRLHGAEELYTSGYTDESLDQWAKKVSRWSAQGCDVFVYFDNDAKVHAPHDALRLMERLGLRLGGGATGNGPGTH